MSLFTLFINKEFLSIVNFNDRVVFPTSWHVPSPLLFLTDTMSGLKCLMQRVTLYSTFVTLITSCPEVQCLFAMLPEIGSLHLDPYPNAASHILATVSQFNCFFIIKNKNTWTIIHFYIEGSLLVITMYVLISVYFFLVNKT